MGMAGVLYPLASHLSPLKVENVKHTKLELIISFGATALRRAVAFLVSCLYKIAKIFAASERNVYF